MIISVTERTREIGLRLAVGAKRGNVLAQFLLEAAFLAGLGGIVGVATAGLLGFALKLVVQSFSAVPPGWSVAAGLITSVGVGLAAGFFPARRAAAMDPAEALRHE
jgi:macrolide transport system ATP-binding/permease protein